MLVLDEMDQLDSKGQDVLYTVFEWPWLIGSRLVLIGKCVSCAVTVLWPGAAVEMPCGCRSSVSECPEGMARIHPPAGGALAFFLLEKAGEDYEAGFWQQKSV